ncbi:MAG: hypothetical protein LBB42_02570 [Coriobacteriales bacterium]|jgi:uncharacterized Zn finger protein (UPF0148 family)|nr:hypothetical protein [Coriobacteriales bacterium]
MAATNISCSKCGSSDYKLLDAKTGQVMCNFCRNNWIVEELKTVTETEKFLEEQAKQPRIIMDNTTDTEKKVMDMVTSVAGGGCLRSITGIIRMILIAVVVIVVIFVVLGIINSMGGFGAIFGQLGQGSK